MPPRLKVLQILKVLKVAKTQGELCWTEVYDICTFLLQQHQHRTLMAIQNERYRSDTMMEAWQQEANAHQAGILDPWPLTIDAVGTGDQLVNPL